VMREGIPFREAYRRVGTALKSERSTGGDDEGGGQ
jgi:argininosuccinate lyase